MRREAEFFQILPFQVQRNGFLDVGGQLVEGGRLGYHWQVQALGDVLPLAAENSNLYSVFHDKR